MQAKNCRHFVAVASTSTAPLPQRRKPWGTGVTRPPRIWRNSLKLGQNYAYRNPKLLQLLGDFVPQTPYRSSFFICMDPTGGLLSPRPLHRTFPHILYQVCAPALPACLPHTLCRTTCAVYLCFSWCAHVRFTCLVFLINYEHPITAKSVCIARQHANACRARYCFPLFCLSVCLSTVCLSVGHTSALYRNERIYRETLSTYHLVGA